MVQISLGMLPETALLAKYAAQEGCFTDCYITDVSGTVRLADYVEAFYTTHLFKLERVILNVALSLPSTDEDARKLAVDEADTFSAWVVEARTEDQLLVADRKGRTRSWLMVRPAPGDGNKTRLHFGSAVLPVRNEETGAQDMSAGFKALSGFHKIYARALLAAAAHQVSRSATSP